MCHLHNASLNSLVAFVARRENCRAMIQGDEVDIADQHASRFVYINELKSSLRSRDVCVCLLHPMSLEALNLHSSERQTNKNRGSERRRKGEFAYF